MARRNRQNRLIPRSEGLEERALLSVGTVLVGFHTREPSWPVQSTLRSLRATIVAHYENGPVELRLPEGTDLEAAARKLQATRTIRYAEVTGTVRIEAIPNDPGFGQLWGLHQSNNVDVDAPEAWDITIGSSSVIVAVIDTGVDITHPDLAPRIWTNPREIAGNGIDDDRNGFRDDYRGWNFISNTPVVRDSDGHGTHVAGIIAATMNNGMGGVGVSPGVRIMPLKFIGPSGEGSISDAVRAIYYAVNNGARVINASWGGITYSAALADAISFAGARGVVVVAAAGNESSDNDRNPTFPANLGLSNLITVAAIGSDGQLASFSNYGARTVDVAAPGVSIRSTIPGGGYASFSGTSMAVPHVAGVVALLASHAPQLSAAQLVERIRTTVKPLAGLEGKLIAPGVVSAYRGLVNANSSVWTSGSSDPLVLRSDSLMEIILSSEEYLAVNGGTPEAFVAGLYRDLLGRAAVGDPGSAGWVAALQNGATRGQVARAILSAPEARRTQIARWFQDFLGRSTALGALKADPVIGAWGDQVAGGRAWSEVLLIILGSDEYYAAAGGTPQGLVEKLYGDLLGRSAGLDPSSTGWVNLLAGGLPRHQVAQGILQALEARQTLIARWFQQYLGRGTPLALLKYDPNIVAWARVLAF